jgi:quercetin dioxygenase-like cupin family protein
MRVAGENLGASVYALEPGERTFPYHYELGNDELLLVVEGQPTLREPTGERTLSPGDCVLFQSGPEGAHELINRSTQPVPVLLVSNFAVPRAAVQVDANKIMVSPWLTSTPWSSSLSGANESRGPPPGRPPTNPPGPLARVATAFAGDLRLPCYKVKCRTVHEHGDHRGDVRQVQRRRDE